MTWVHSKPLACARNLLKWQHTGLSSASSSARKGHQTCNAYCSDLVRKFDYESYLCSLLLPNDLRRAAFAIRAFSTELAMIRDMVSTQGLGMMRLQFWRDTLDQVYKGQPPQQPVAQELAWVLRKNRLSKLRMKKLIDCREQTLSDQPYHSLKDLEDYSHNSVSSVYYLILEAAGVQDINADHLADHAGKAQGLSYLLRGIPFNASKGRVIIPTQLLAKHSVSQEDFLRGKHESEMKDVVFEIASAAYSHLEMVSSLQAKLPKNVRSVFLPVVPCKHFLEKLQRRNFHIFDSTLHVKDHLLPLRLWCTSRLKGKLI